MPEQRLQLGGWPLKRATSSRVFFGDPKQGVFRLMSPFYSTNNGLALPDRLTAMVRAITTSRIASDAGPARACGIH